MMLVSPAGAPSLGVRRGGRGRSKNEEKRVPQGLQGDTTALRAKGFQILTRLHRARAAVPRNPALTPPEWELLAQSGLNTMAAVRQRMVERALLAAYDGAPAALTESQVERTQTPMHAARASERGPQHGETCQETLLETTLCYDPEAERVSVRYAVTRRRVAVNESGRCLETLDGEFYAVTFDARTGGVARRECGTLRQTPGEPAARHDVTVEIIAP